jgi:GT2 family glycosyltransferase
MALLAMAVYDTDENKRTDLTKKSIESIVETTDLNKHRLIIIDNASCEKTKKALRFYETFANVSVITNETNVGTAKAINHAWKLRDPNEYLLKVDNDVVIHSYDWVDEMQEAIEREPKIGIIGLKRKDLIENPFRTDMYKSTLHMLPHERMQRWVIVEKVNHVIGTCQMYNPKLIDVIGGLMQPGLYGFDDTLASFRSSHSGFYNCFLPHIEIDHIDVNETPYWKEKQSLAMEGMNAFNQLKLDIANGVVPIKVEL